MYSTIKRGGDFILSCIGFIILLPLFLVLVVVIRLDSPGPALFRQKRIGIHKKHFYIWKFRTMSKDAPKDIPTHLQKDTELHMTSLGRFLRRTSLDELPQLINIIKGEMSIVGPRPALWNQYDLVEERDKYGVHNVKPGLTGWAQINGRDELDISQKARLDGEYVKKIGLGMDVKCFFGTFLPVLRAEGVWEGETEKKG